jgi:hypothetical protein
MLRYGALIGIFVATLYFVLPPSTFANLELAFRDHFDTRPAHAVLIIGNSRTYYHDTPSMLKRMADSDHARERYDIVMRAVPGGTLEWSWKDSVTQQLLKEPWREVIIQAESNAQSRDDAEQRFFDYGKRLISEVGNNGAKPVLIVNWVYGEDLFKSNTPGMRSWLYDKIQDDYAYLSQQTEAQLVNVGRVWEFVRAASSDLPLYEDGNHPTVQGSYLSALMLYVYLSGKDGSEVTYVPADMSAEQAATIKRVVGEWVQGPRLTPERSSGLFPN